MASGKQLARLFQRSCSLFSQNSSKITNGIACNCSLTSKKYQIGTFSVNRYLHTSGSLLQRQFKGKQYLNTAAPLQAQNDEGSSSKELVVSKVNEALQKEDLGRLFAVVHVQGKQRKITAEDVIIVQGHFYPSVGDKIRLEKVLLVGGRDFTLIGRPILSRKQVKVEATVIEKTLSHFHVHFDYKQRRDKLKKFNVSRKNYTMLLINSIEVNPIPET